MRTWEWFILFGFLSSVHMWGFVTHLQPWSSLSCMYSVRYATTAKIGINVTKLQNRFVFGKESETYKDHVFDSVCFFICFCSCG